MSDYIYTVCGNILYIAHILTCPGFVEEGLLLKTSRYILEEYLGLQWLSLNLYYSQWQKINIIPEFMGFPISRLVNTALSLITCNHKTAKDFSGWPFCYRTSDQLRLVKLKEH